MYWDNIVLIQTKNSQGANKKSFKKGKEYQVTYKNPDVETVKWKFAGIKELVEIYSDLKDGEEIAYSEGFCRKKRKYFKNDPC